MYLYIYKYLRQYNVTHRTLIACTRLLDTYGHFEIETRSQAVFIPLFKKKTTPTSLCASPILCIPTTPWWPKAVFFPLFKKKTHPPPFALHQFCASRRPHDGQILRRARSHLVVKTKNNGTSSWQNRIKMTCLLNEQCLQHKSTL